MVDEVNPFEAAESEAPPAAPQPQLYYPNVAVFIEEFLVHVWPRYTDNATRLWCPQWWSHAEATVRLNALWRSWEAARLDPANGMAVWLRDLLDPTMNALTAPEGCFRGCSIEGGHHPQAKDLVVVAPPPGYFE